MRNSLVQTAGRRGFTLVELMIVIAIIGLLVAILAAALGPLLSKGPEMITRSEINQMGIALESFKSQFGFYPPSRLLICEFQWQYSDPAVRSAYSPRLCDDSQYYLLKMFRVIGPNWNSPTGIDFDQSQLITGTRATLPQLLTGDKCLVFFLGGIQRTVNGV